MNDLTQVRRDLEQAIKNAVDRKETYTNVIAFIFGFVIGLLQAGGCSKREAAELFYKTWETIEQKGKGQTQ